MSDRNERDTYRGDVWYDEWRAGLPEDSVSDDEIERGFDDGSSAESLVSYECERQAGVRDQREADALWEQEQEAYDRQLSEEEPQMEEPTP